MNAEPYDEENAEHQTSPLAISEWAEWGDASGMESVKYEVADWLYSTRDVKKATSLHPQETHSTTPA
jgi:hypothetical protein